MDIYPVNEQRISDVERGFSSKAILPLPAGKSFTAGDSILFAQAHPTLDAEGEPRFVMGGDSVRVLLTDVVDLEATDPTTGQALFQISWVPLGSWAPIPSVPRNRKVRVS